MDEVCLKVVVHNETQPAVSTPSPVILYNRSFDTRNHYILILKKNGLFLDFLLFLNRISQKLHIRHFRMVLYFSVNLAKKAVIFLSTQNQLKAQINGKCQTLKIYIKNILIIPSFDKISLFMFYEILFCFKPIFLQF